MRLDSFFENPGERFAELNSKDSYNKVKIVRIQNLTDPSFDDIYPHDI